MTRYLLDTNICIFLLKNLYGVTERIKKAGCENCYVSDITLAELYYGASNSGRKEEKMQGVRCIEDLFTVLPIHDVLETYADVKSDLRRNGQLIDDFDLLIGSTAVAYGLVLVTENVRHLSRIPGITIENWIERGV